MALSQRDTAGETVSGITVDMVSDSLAKAGYNVANGNVYIGAAADIGLGAIMAVPIDSVVKAIATVQPYIASGVMQFIQNRMLQVELKKTDATHESARAATLKAITDFKAAREANNDCIEKEALRLTGEHAMKIVTLRNADGSGRKLANIKEGVDYAKEKLADSATANDRWRTKHGEHRAKVLAELTYQPERKAKKGTATSAEVEETWGE